MSRTVSQGESVVTLSMRPDELVAPMARLIQRRNMGQRMATDDGIGYEQRIAVLGGMASTYQMQSILLSHACVGRLAEHDANLFCLLNRQLGEEAVDDLVMTEDGHPVSDERLGELFDGIFTSTGACTLCFSLTASQADRFFSVTRPFSEDEPADDEIAEARAFVARIVSELRRSSVESERRDLNEYMMDLATRMRLRVHDMLRCVVEDQVIAFIEHIVSPTDRERISHEMARINPKRNGYLYVRGIVPSDEKSVRERADAVRRMVDTGNWQDLVVYTDSVPAEVASADDAVAFWLSYFGLEGKCGDVVDYYDDPDMF